MNGAPTVNEGLKKHLRCGPASERVVPGGKEDDLVHGCWGGWTVFGGQRIPFDAPESYFLSMRATQMQMSFAERRTVRYTWDPSALKIMITLFG